MVSEFGVEWLTNKGPDGPVVIYAMEDEIRKADQ